LVNEVGVVRTKPTVGFESVTFPDNVVPALLVVPAKLMTSP
jgi:hypothetical protein